MLKTTSFTTSYWRDDPKYHSFEWNYLKPTAIYQNGVIPCRVSFANWRHKLTSVYLIQSVDNGDYADFGKPLEHKIVITGRSRELLRSLGTFKLKFELIWLVIALGCSIERVGLREYDVPNLGVKSFMMLLPFF